MLFALLFALNQPACGALCRADAFVHYSRLLARAHLGHSPYEEAAFLVSNNDGRIRTINWRPGERHAASFHGRRPEHCVGIMHTHPIGDNEPSRGDRLEAQRIQLPIVVVTPEAVSVAWPDGTMSYLADRTGWNATPRQARQ